MTQLLYLDTNAALAERVDDLVRRLTRAQKAAQLVDNTPAIPELCIGAYSWWNEALHGVASAGLATVFPQALGLAATFDTDLMTRVANAIGIEARIKHSIAAREGRAGTPFSGLNFYSPNINIYRDPRWGRGQETYGEDPCLTAAMAVAFIRGLQGTDPVYLQAAATAKHFAAHSGPERGRHAFNAFVSLHDLEDTYLPAFRSAVMDGRVAAVMAAYNRVNGVPACANPWLLGQRLRRDWGFAGQIVSDCDGVRHVFEQHHAVASMAQAYAAALGSGLTSVLDFVHGNDPAPIIAAMDAGLLQETEIDAALRANLNLRFRLGEFDPPERVPFNRLPETGLDSPEHRALALEAARRSIVLLQNRGVLPLPAAPSSIAVVGPLADSFRVLLGSYYGTPSAATTVLQGLRRLFVNSVIRYEPGTMFLLDPAPAPAHCLRTADGLPGLTAEFFAGSDHQGEVLLRQAMQPRYDGTPATRPSQVPANAPVRWSGYLMVAEDGDYDLGLYGNSNRLLLDGQLLIDDSGPHAPRQTTLRVRLHRGAHDLRIETLPGLEQHMLLQCLRVSPDCLQRAVDVAGEADVVVAVVGYTADLENEEIKIDVPGFLGGDRLSLDLPEAEQALLHAVAATGKPLVVVLMSGGPISSPWLGENALAILQCWYPGEEGGTAIAEILAGRINPGGRLPVTIYRDTEQLPAFTDYSMNNRTYRYFRGTPLYRFGHGLSYTTFQYDQLALPQQVHAETGVEVSVRVSNVGAMDGDEVVQLYIEFSGNHRPLRALRGFSRVALRAGDSRLLTFRLSARDLSQVDGSGTRFIAQGEHRLSIGGGQPLDGVACVTGSFHVDSPLVLPP